jgi:uncharacterized protein (TIGR00661 family)
LHFQYRGERLCYFKSICAAAPFLWQLSDSVTRVARLLEREQPDLAITDFEPILARAAERCGVPYISFDHQHFLLANDLSSLPLKLRWKAWSLGFWIRRFYRRQQRTIVSSFYSPPLRPGCQDVLQTGVLLRRQILEAQPVVGGHLLVYMRRFMRRNLLEALCQCGREVRIYGLGQQPVEGNLRYFEIDETGFLQDLISCDAVISNAGNQLVGEALYLSKPMLALPESGNFEQAINGHYLRESGGGDWMEFDRVGTEQLQQFIRQIPHYRRQICPEKVVGNRQAVAAIREELAKVGAALPAAEEFRAAYGRLR